MKLIIKFPTRNRPDKFFNVLDMYYDFLMDKSVEFIVTCDLDDSTMNNDFIKEKFKAYPTVKVFYGNNKSKIEAVNANLDNVSFDIVLLASDDMIPIRKGFDSIIKNRMIEYYPDSDGVLWFNDGFQGNKLNTLCILGKKYYDRFGYIYNHEYISVWSDNEFMLVANILGKQTYFNETIIRHQHPDWGYDNRDVIHTLNSTHEYHDRDIFNKRKKTNFGL